MVSRSRARVAIVAHPNSGIVHYSYSLASALAQLPNVRHDNVLVANKAFGCEPVDGLDVAKIFSRTRRLPIELVYFLWFIIRQHIDLVHLQNPLRYPLLTWWVTVLLQIFGVRVVYTAHDVLPHYALGYHSFLMRRIYESADRIIVHSEANHKELLSLAPKVKAVEVIPHGVYDMFRGDSEISRAKARRRLGIGFDKKLLLFFGRIDARKGAEALVAELPRLVAEDADIHLLMAGLVKLPAGHLEGLAAQGGAGEALTIVDEWIPDEDVKVYFSAADVVVLPYLEGSTSGVVKVALAFGKKVIATRVGELPEMLEANDAGILVDFPLSERDMHRIIAILKTEAEAGGGSLSEVRSEYTWPEIATRTQRLYQTVLGDR